MSGQTKKKEKKMKKVTFFKVTKQPVNIVFLICDLKESSNQLRR